MILDDIHNGDKLKELETRLSVQEQKLSEVTALCGDLLKKCDSLQRTVETQQSSIRKLMWGKKVEQ